ncbi:MAG TPA: hypothetical protein VGR26_09250 [Acidimicrobiales bacterium]|nr:hypothetical protein [Acidimicrobiales bacterium]
MSLPALYEEGLMQRSVLGSTALNAYKLGLIEALLKETLRVAATADGGEAVPAGLRTALEVARWEPPSGRRAAGPPATADPQR